jgi:hypothetical protein
MALLDAAGGRPIWSRTIVNGSAVHGLVGSPAHDGTRLYVPSASPPDGTFALSPADGHVLWQTAAAEPVYSSPAVGTGVVAVGTGAVFGSTRSEPAWRPPLVAFSPPKAPPISAPDVPTFTLAMPQSDPAADSHRSAERTSVVKRLLDRPWGTALLSATASSRLSTSNTCRMGAKISSATTGMSGRERTSAGSTEQPAGP